MFVSHVDVHENIRVLWQLLDNKPAGWEDVSTHTQYAAYYAIGLLSQLTKYENY